MGLVCGFALSGQRMSPAVPVKECQLPSSHQPSDMYLEGNSIGEKKRILALNIYMVAQMVKSLPARFNTLVGKIPWRRKWQPTPMFLPGKSHGQRSLAGYSPQGHKRVRHNLATEHHHQISPYIYQLTLPLYCQSCSTLYLSWDHIKFIGPDLFF